MTPRLAVFAAFIAFGIGYGMWAGTIATVALRSGVTPQTLGFAVTGFIAASLFGMTAGGAISRWATVRTILIMAIATTAVSLTALMQAATPAAFVVGLVVYGFVNGMFDGAMNAEGTVVEQEMRRPILSGFHASASFAVAASAIVGSLVAVSVGTVATAVIAVCGYGFGAVFVIMAMPNRVVPIVTIEQASRGWRFGRPIVLLGLIVGVCITGETAAAMFSAPTLALQAPELAGYAGFGATAFAFCQGLVRCVADPLRRRMGDLRLMAGSILAAVAGFVVVATSGSFGQSALGFALVGIATACIVPCGFSLAPSYSRVAAAQALGILALVSALPRIPAPLVFGEVAQRFGYSAAFALNTLLFCLALVFVLMLRRARR